MKMIATDEAGYGPNLGPLVISGTLWNPCSPEQLRIFVDDFHASGFLLGDSKKIYHAGGSIAPLETVVLGAVQSIRGKIETSRELFRATTIKDPVDLCSGRKPIHLPIAAHPDRVDEVRRKFRQASRRFEIGLKDVHSMIVFPKEFNGLLDRYDSKGALLSDLTLRIVRQLDGDENDDLRILCDKHGGRNRYLELLQRFYPDEIIGIERESRPESCYRFKTGSRNVEAQFVSKGEALTPIALSSMISKYQRELAMMEFNAFWRERLPKIRPTAGYPEDAKRFKKEIADVQADLGIDDNDLWREK